MALDSVVGAMKVVGVDVGAGRGIEVVGVNVEKWYSGGVDIGVEKWYGSGVDVGVEKWC